MILDYDIPANQMQADDVNVMSDYQGTLNNMLQPSMPSAGQSTQAENISQKPELTGGEKNK